MKAAIYLLLFAVIPASLANSCEPWPQNVPSLHDCCVFPHYLDLYAYAECMKHCLENHGSDDNCLLDCYINITRIIQDGELDAQSVRDIYMENVDTKAWESILTASIDKCKSVVNASDESGLRWHLFTFFGCVKSESLPHCLEFYGTNDCYESEKFFLKCNNVQMDCEKWPERFSNETLINCCNFPQIFDDYFTEMCEMQCAFDGDVLKCIEQCRYVATGIVSKGAINVEMIMGRIKSHRNYGKEWDGVIDEAVGTCLGEYYVRHANDTSTFSYSQFESCIDFRMSAACMSLRTDFECRTLKTFMENCPMTKPAGYEVTKRDGRSVNYDVEESLIE
jgi:hypothetical protein